MARTKAQRKQSKTKQRADVTPERAQRSEFQSAGMARKLVPPILTLRAKGHITQSEFEALDWYATQATLAQDKSTKDSCDFSVGGATERGEPPLTVQSAKKEKTRLDRLLGDLRGIAFAVCVEDMSLTEWACFKHGSRERYRNGKFVELVPRAKDAVFFARWELKFAANRMRP
jgi:hypothetical protein